MIVKYVRPIIFAYSMNKVHPVKVTVKMDGFAHEKLFIMLIHVITDNTWTRLVTVSNVLLVTIVRV